MLRRLFHAAFYAAASFSALLLLATLILWPVSYYRQMLALRLTHSDGAYKLYMINGRAGVWYEDYDRRHRQFHEAYYFYTGKSILPYEAPWSYLSWGTPDGIDTLGGYAKSTYLGVRWLNFRGFRKFTLLAIPFSYLAVLFAILPALAWRSVRRRRKAARAARVGLCPHCGYDLRVHLAGGAGDKCPECGTPIVSPILKANGKTPND